MHFKINKILLTYGNKKWLNFKLKKYIIQTFKIQIKDLIWFR